MDKEQFLRSMEAIANLPVNSLTGKEPFHAAADWDSLAVVGFLSFAHKEVGAPLSLRELKTCRSYDDLYQRLLSLKVAYTPRLAS